MPEIVKFKVWVYSKSFNVVSSGKEHGTVGRCGKWEYDSQKLTLNLSDII